MRKLKTRLTLVWWKRFQTYSSVRIRDFVEEIFVTVVQVFIDDKSKGYRHEAALFIVVDLGK